MGTGIVLSVSKWTSDREHFRFQDYGPGTQREVVRVTTRDGTRVEREYDLLEAEPLGPPRAGPEAAPVTLRKRVRRFLGRLARGGVVENVGQG